MTEPGSAEWHEQRAGFLTGSNAELILRRSPAYIRQLIRIRESIDRGTYTAGEDVRAPSLDWGKKQEPAAIAHYELETGRTVDPTRFCVDPKRAHFRGTPDGFVGTRGLVEVKCPFNAGLHLSTIHEQRPPFGHRCQMQAYMLITGREWCDYISYDPRSPLLQQIFVYRFEFDSDLADRLSTAVDDVWALVLAGVTQREDISGIPDLF